MTAPVLVFGAGGQVGIETIRACQVRGISVLPSTRAEIDLANPNAANELIRSNDISGVIMAAAFTAVDAAETESEVAHAINARAPKEIANACARKGVPLVHFSTDYVFDGKASSPYLESDQVNPIGVYGKSKLEGERAVLGSEGPAAVVRLSWIFSAHNSNFLKTMLRVGPARGAVRVVSDQLGCPTPAKSAAEVGLDILFELMSEPNKSGLYHFCGDLPVSWAEFAEAIFQAKGIDIPVDHITTDEYPTPARRPAYSVLSTKKIEQTFAIRAANWRLGIEDVIAELLRLEEE